jgi:hypothetical protein
MMKIPEYVYLEEPGFIEYDEESIVELMQDGLSQACFRYSIHGVLIDNRVTELLGFTQMSGLFFSDAVDLRAKQIEATMSAFPEEDNSCLEKYLEFLRGL